MKSILVLILGVVIIAGGAYFYLRQPTSLLSQTPSTNNPITSTANATSTSDHPTTQIANPASVNCEQTMGGTLEIVNTPDGQQGMCHLQERMVCEEWALWRGECGPKETLPNTVPLYKGVTWSPGYATAIEGIRGVAATSSAGVNLQDISKVTTPFTDYYRNKLKAAGWEDDIAHEAGGAGSTLDAYKKGDQLIFVSFNTKFKGTQPDEPVSCPCDVTFRVFEGKMQ
jgi:putative hemolysin